MGKREIYEEKFQNMILPVLEQNGFDLYDVEYVKEGSNWYLRAYIDKPEGITIDDCELVSRRVSDLLDEDDFIPDAYTLEVSSPGLGRQLKKDRHFEKSLGEEVELKLFQGIKITENGKEKNQKEWRGILKRYDAENLYIETETQENEIAFERKNISIVRLTIDF